MSDDVHVRISTIRRKYRLCLSQVKNKEISDCFVENRLARIWEVPSVWIVCVQRRSVHGKSPGDEIRRNTRPVHSRKRRIVQTRFVTYTTTIFVTEMIVISSSVVSVDRVAESRQFSKQISFRFFLGRSQRRTLRPERGASWRSDEFR